MHPVQERTEQRAEARVTVESDDRETGPGPAISIDLDEWPVRRIDDDLPDPLLGMYFTG